MNYDHRLNPVNEPFLTRRNRALEATKKEKSMFLEKMAKDMSDMQKEGYSASQVRTELGMPSAGSAGLEGRSEFVDAEPYADKDLGWINPREEFDLMPDTDIPIDVTKRAFGESGHGFTVFKPMRRDFQIEKDED